jgi:hypothetical protein
VRRTWLDRRIDEALLAIVLEAGFLLARRRVSRMLRRLARGTAVLGGVGAVAAAVGAGTVGVLVAAALYRRRAKRSAALGVAPASAGRPPDPADWPGAPMAGSVSGGQSVGVRAFEPTPDGS